VPLPTEHRLKPVLLESFRSLEAVYCFTTDLAEGEAPELASAEVGQPQRGKPEADGVAAWARPLMDYFVGGGRDLG
jgi:hypothetical protein